MKDSKQQASWQACSFIMEGKTFSMETYRKGLSSFPDNPYQELLQFLDEWFDDSPTLHVFTSGSTGTPKELLVRKELYFRFYRHTQRTACPERTDDEQCTYHLRSLTSSRG